MTDLSKMSVEELLTNTVNFPSVIAELTRRMTPPDGHVRLPDGRDAKVLGTLARTADNFIACQDSVVWHPIYGACYPVPDGLNVAAKVYGGNSLVPVSECYSTREAAESTRKEAT